MCAFSSAATIGNYFVLRTLGTGSTGKVKLGRHIHTNDYVALKIIPHSLLKTNPTLYHKARREIAVLKLLSATCPNRPSRLGVLQLLDVYHTPKATVLVLEYCPSGELFDHLLEHGFLQQSVLLDYFQQLVHALAFCHQRSICHRDIKPENILLTQDGRLKFADFGLANLNHPGTFLHSSVGSPHYCAPEVLLGEQYDGRAADVWSLGVLLYTMATGGLPFQDDNLHRLFSKIQSAVFYIPEQLPKDLSDLICSMLVQDPALRPTMVDIMQSPWFKSSPVRPDILSFHPDLPPHMMPPKENTPIVDPNPHIISLLADLGFGLPHILRRRLSSSRACRERQLYHLLNKVCAQMRHVATDDQGGGAGGGGGGGGASVGTIADDDVSPVSESCHPVSPVAAPQVAIPVSALNPVVAALTLTEFPDSPLVYHDETASRAPAVQSR